MTNPGGHQKRLKDLSRHAPQNATAISPDDLPHFSTHPHAIFRPLPFLHPTHIDFIAHTDDHTGAAGVISHWSSRASRKNRFAPRPVHVTHQRQPSDAVEEADPRKRGQVMDQRLQHPRTKLKVHLTWDISFWVAVIFTLGSILWVINGFLLYLPISPTPVPSYSNAAAWIAFAGGTLFEIGSYLTVVEAINTGHEQLFGPAIWSLIGDEYQELERRWTRTWPKSQGGGDGGEVDRDKAKLMQGATRKLAEFRWIGTASWRELGFLASLIQFFGATIFWVATVTGIPGVIPNLSTDPPVAITDVFYWTPQVIGGMGFVISSLLLMIEVQRKWWLPNLASLGWHIGVWNLVGGVGFTLCGALGYASAVSTKVDYQSVLATFWGSWAFLIGSVIQLWETLWREDPTAIDDAVTTKP